MSKRKTPGLNTGAMSDISFLLLTFFLLTSSINTEQGIPRKLPPPKTEDAQDKKVDINRRNVLNVLVKDLDRTGEMIDLALASGASTCDGVSFQSSQASAAYDQALVTAIKEGRRKAELMALGCGRILGELVLVEENYGDYGGALVARSEASMDKGAGTQIVSNSLSYSATVTMTFLMQ